MRRCLVGMLLAVLGIGAAYAAPPSPLQQVIQAAKTRALNGAWVDWPRIEREAMALQQASRDGNGTDAAIAYVLKALDDGHSFYIPPAVARAERSIPTPDGSTTTGTPDQNARTMERPPIAQASAKPDAHGYLRINGWRGAGAQIASATHQVRNALVAALAHGSCGLVLDVSGNTGGNMWPMMGGIAPLYDEGTIQRFDARVGQGQRIRIVGGVLHSNDSAFPNVPDLVSLPATPRHIALLLGKRTASSGEILALGFHAQSNVRSFGRPTAGKTSANSTVTLSNGGMASITTAALRDRNDI
jgi:carboxyl-terminal processing protease